MLVGLALFLALVPGMSAEHAVIFAVIPAATDPVSVLAIFKENGVVSGLRTLMEGESIFNDAIVIVAYLIAVEIAFSDGVARKLMRFGHRGEASWSMRVSRVSTRSSGDCF